MRDMDSFKLCAAAFLCTVVIVAVRQYRQDFALTARMAATVILLSFSAALLTPTLRWLEQIGGEAFDSASAGVLWRALAIVCLVRVCSAFCRDCGEPGVAACLEFAGKAELMLLCIPLLERLLQAVRTLAAW